MKALLIYYSRTGTTKKVAEKIATLISCDVEEIIDAKNRAGVIGYLGIGKDVTQKIETKIKESKYNPQDYDLLIIGTPVWVWTLSLPVRAYLEKYKESIKNIAYFATQGGDGAEKAFFEMTKICGKNLKRNLFC